jgi:hypothetical protein
MSAPTTPVAPSRRDRALTALAVFALAVTLWVFLQRLAAVHESAAIAPGTVQTTGCEEESMFSIWRAARGQPVYLDPAQPPYASAYFNWLFYAVYGAACEGSPDSKLVLVGRTVTATIALLAALALGVCAATLPKIAPLRAAGGAFAAFLFFGPLGGWWTVTLRPDIPGLAAEVLGIVCFLRWHHRRPLLATVIAMLFFYVAWAFKPIVLGGPLAVGLFLLSHRCWRDAFILAAGSAALWTLTLALGGAAYRSALFGTAVSYTFVARDSLHNFRHAAVCLAPLIVFLPSIYQTWRRQRARQTRSPAHDALHLVVVALVPVTAIFAAAAGRIGAAPNYFFACASLLTVAVIVGLFPLDFGRLPVALGLGLIVVLQLGLLAGRWGTLTLRPNALELASRWQVFRELPEPRFSEDLRLNLPWLSPHSPPLVLAFNYRLFRGDVRGHADAGVGGMIERGEFASLLLQTSRGGIYDGGSLARYRPHVSSQGFTGYLLAQPGAR